MNEDNQQKKEALSQQIFKKMAELMTTALSLVAALAWNDAIQNLFNEIFGTQSTVIAKFVYALLITVLTVLLALKVTSIIKRAEKAAEKLEERVKTLRG